MSNSPFGKLRFFDPSAPSRPPIPRLPVAPSITQMRARAELAQSRPPLRGRQGRGRPRIFELTVSSRPTSTNKSFCNRWRVNLRCKSDRNYNLELLCKKKNAVILQSIALNNHLRPEEFFRRLFRLPLVPAPPPCAPKPAVLGHDRGLGEQQQAPSPPWLNERGADRSRHTSGAIQRRIGLKIYQDVHNRVARVAPPSMGRARLLAGRGSGGKIKCSNGWADLLVERNNSFSFFHFCKMQFSVAPQYIAAQLPQRDSSLSSEQRAAGKRRGQVKQRTDASNRGP